MKLRQHSNINKDNRLAIAALTCVLAASAACQTAVAQVSDGMGTYPVPADLSGGHESLLPPEVVPLDPTVANSLSAQQAEQRVEQGSQPQVPGLVTGNGMQKASDFRRAAFESLYNSPQAGQQQQQQWQAGQQSQVGQQANFSNPMNGQILPQVSRAPQMQSQLPNYAPYEGSVANYQPAQTQTLSGGSKNVPQVYNTKRGGITNALSALPGYGMSALYFMRGSNPAMSAGIYGLTMTGFGVRNGFRF